MPHFFCRPLVVASILILSAAVSSQGQTWTGLAAPDNKWSTSGNWDTGVPGTGNTATFNSAGNANTSISLSNGVQPIGSIVFDTVDAAAYTLGVLASGDQFSVDSGGSITVNSTVVNPQTLNAAIATNGPLNVTVSNAATAGLNLAGVISGSGPVTISNVGGVTLSAQNTYTGGTAFPTTAAQGQLRIGADTVGSPGSVTSGPFGTGTITTSSSLPQIFQPIGADRTIANAWDFNPGGIFVGSNTTVDPTPRSLTLTGNISTVGNRTLTNNIQAPAALVLGSAASPATLTLGGNLGLQTQTGTSGPGGGRMIVNDHITGAFGVNVQNGAVVTITNNNSMTAESNVQNSAAGLEAGTMIVNNVPINPTDAGIAGPLAIRTGTLAGNGTIAGNGRILTSGNGAAHLGPGNGAGFANGPGKLTFYANFDFSGTSNCSGCNYDAEIGGLIAGTEYDQVAVNGTLTIGTTAATPVPRGTLNVTTINGFTRPAFNASFEIMKAGTRAGGPFANVNLPSGDTTNWSVEYTATSVLVNVLGTGDFNHDTVVDAADFVTWRLNPAANGGPGGYDTWRANFGNSAGSGSGALSGGVVPEPTTLLLLFLALAGVSAASARSRL